MATLKEQILQQITEEEQKLGRKIVLRRYLAEINPHLVQAQGAAAQALREENPLDPHMLAAVNLAAALATRVPLCIKNNLRAAQNAGLSTEQIGAIMAQTQFMTGTAVLSASLEGLEALLGPLD
ncbi:MAG: carboxymuconolactone decarboxylase family protein [Firmicutes bacterium]|nr:carboxymuconolactone decarboxylase family protein [Bacillota bacterium]